MGDTRQPRVGVWLVGACGRVGSTVAMGLAALARGRAPATGLVSALPEFAGCGLPDPGAMILGGHELRQESLLEAVEDSHRQAGLFSRERITDSKASLQAMQRNIRAGTASGLASEVTEALGMPIGRRKESPAAAVQRLSSDVIEFKQRHRLDQVVVVNIASSEPSLSPALARLADRDVDRLFGKGRLSPKGTVRPSGRTAQSRKGQFPPSCLYALAAIEAGCPYINFTPSTGISLPAIRKRADKAGIPYMGNDGKTGETLVKSALAPMFAMRNLSVLSWVGQNILGNRDGAVLQNPRTQAAKLRTKDGVVSRIVGGSPTTKVSIDYVPSLDDWKVAWDFIHFEGFLGTKMSMQFTWQGCDSILAAPLIIDLVRFTALECRRSASGPMQHLAFFFKDPIGVDAQDLATHWNMLTEHVTGVAGQTR